MKTSLLTLCILFLLVLSIPRHVYATHVRAGEITTRRVSSTSLTYEITLTVYYDISPSGRGAALAQGDVAFCFGDGPNSTRVPRVESLTRNINPNTSYNIYRTLHTYSGPGTYNISCTIVNRNAGTRNIPNSVNTTFQLRTTVVVNASLGLNSTPVLLNPPLDSARVGQRWCHNPAAFDADGDSLAYRLYTPSGRLGGTDLTCGIETVRGYSSPTTFGNNPVTEAGASPATLTVNPITGDVCWDAPAETGQYNIAFIVEEWRNGIKIGEIVRDVQIIVTPSINRRPNLQVPQDICVEAGTLIQQSITATDPDNNRLEITAYGGPFNRNPDGRPIALVPTPSATFSVPTQPQSAPARGTFSWQTACSHIRREPYDVVFRVVDFPTIAGQTQLATLQSFRITVYAPRPQNLTARPATDAAGPAIALNWAAYSCALPNARIVVYRKEGCTDIPEGPCQTGLPVNSGYTEVTRLPASATTYTDNNNGQGLQRGVQYSYRLVVEFSGSNPTSSVASNQACINLPARAPLITNVTVDTTDATRGVITVRWTRPPGINPQDGTGPFQYRLFRTTGSDGTAYQEVTRINTSLQPNAPDTVFTDRALNTTANAYRYRIEFFFTDPATGQLQRLDATEPASSVRLTATPGVRRVQLAWQANTPWSNDNQQHRVYRSKTGPNGPFNLVALVAVQGANTYTYTDTGADTYANDGVTTVTMSTDSSYCYRVETVGRYSAPLDQTLRYNFSQGVCAVPIDTTRPCPPVLSVDSLVCASLAADAFCNQTSFANNLSWTAPSGSGCDANVVKYNIYYAPCAGQELQLVGSVNAHTLTFRHENLPSFAGCYEVRAVSRSGRESVASNRVCKDNCPLLQMPNVFTPNGDGKNDVFEPLRCPRFVETAELLIFNRWGVKVYQGSGIRWEGRTSSGQSLPGGVYYYQVNVKFISVSCNAPTQVIKGWVEMLQESAGTN